MGLKKVLHLSGGTQLSLMMVVTTISQFIAIYKSTIIAAAFGASTELDAYNFANNMATFFLTFISSGITAVVIPAYVKKVDKKSINTFLTVIFSVVGSLLLLLFLGRGLLVDILTNRDAIFRSAVCNVMLFSILIQLLPAVLGVTTAFYQVNDRFNTPKVIQLVSNVIVVVLLVLIENLTIERYLQILLFGAVVQFVLDAGIAVKCGFRFTPCFGVNGFEYKKLVKIFIPTVFSSGIYMVNTMIDSVLSSNLVTGQLTILSYSNTMVGMVNNMFIGNLSTYAYPKIVKAIKDGENEGQRILWKYSTLFHTAVCLIVVGFICVGREFISVLYERGQFTTEAADRVYVCMAIYILGQQNNIVRDLVYRYFYAHGNTKETTRNGLKVSIINAITSIILSHFIGLYGLVLGTVISGCYSIVAIIYRMKRIYTFSFSVRMPMIEFGKNLCAAFIAIVATFGLKRIVDLNNPIVGFLIYGVVCTIVYAIGLLLVRSQVFVKKYRL